MVRGGGIRFSMFLPHNLPSPPTPWAYAAFGTGGVEILYKVTLRHTDYAIWLIQRAGGGCPPSADSTSGGGGGGGGGAVRIK